MKPSDHFDGKLFFNPDDSSDKSLLDVLKWRRTSVRTPWPVWVENRARPEIAKEVGPGQAVITFVNHATVLVQLPDRELLGHLMLAAAAYAKKQDLADDGYRLVMNCNANGGQTVFHVHLHFLAGRQFSWPPG